MKPTYRNSLAENLLMWSDLTLGHDGSLALVSCLSGWFQICISSLMCLVYFGICYYQMKRVIVILPLIYIPVYNLSIYTTEKHLFGVLNPTFLIKLMLQCCYCPVLTLFFTTLHTFSYFFSCSFK